MNFEQAAKRVAKLASELRRHAVLYYQMDAPLISDAEYDHMFAELKELEEQYPELRPPDSPTKSVGAPLKTSFSPVEHLRPMLSLESSADQAALEDFYRRVREAGGRRGTDFLVQPKIDGLSVELVYRHGNLHTGSTRGDGRVGEDVTPNLRTVGGIPESLTGAAPEVLAVRGEVYMDRQGFLELNRSLLESGQDAFANPRNAAAGSLRQINSQVTASRPLRFFPFELLNASELGLGSDSQALEYLAGLGFDIPWGHMKKATDFLIAQQAHADYADRREELPFEIDGVVLKVDDFALRESMGERTRTPRWAFAWKFPPRQEVTTVADIVAQVGRTGKITPVALLEPVDVGGVTVSRATLHNYDEVERLGVRVGDRVRIERAGDVIPKVAGVAALGEPRGEAATPPEHCPACQTEIVRQGAYHMCPNTIGCPAQVQAAVRHYASRGAMDIESLGPKRVTQLMESELISGTPSLYQLHGHRETLARLEGWGELSADNLIKAIEASRGRPLDRFIFALGIPTVGEAIARDLAARFGSLEEIIAAGEDELSQVPGVGPVVAGRLKEFFARTQSLEAARELARQVSPASVAIPRVRQPLAGRTMVFTGALAGITRQEAEALAREAGARVTGSVSKNTDLVVAGENPGSKVDKARKLGVGIISEQEFLGLLEQEAG